VGPLARSVADARLCLEVIAGPDPSDNLSAPISWRHAANQERPAGEGPAKNRRIAWSLKLGDHAVGAEVAAVFHASIGALQREGWTLEEASPEVGDLGAISWPIMLTELAPMIAGREHLLSPAFQELVRTGSEVSARDYFDAQLQRAEFTRQSEAFFADYDALLTPTTAMPPFDASPRGPVKIGDVLVDVDVDIAPYNLTVVANVTGAPAITLPAGLDRDGLPVGIQVMCRRFADDLCLRLAEQMTHALPRVGPPPISPSR